MTRETTEFDRAGASRLPLPNLTTRPLRLLPFVFLCVWCGLLAGLLEVAAIVVRKQFADINRLYWMSRHFVWLVPLTDLVVFVLLGLFIWLLSTFLHRRGRWLAYRLLCLVTFVSVLWAAFPRIYGLAAGALALGVVARLVPAIERRDAGFRRFVWRSFPALAAAVATLAASIWGYDRYNSWRERTRPLPSAGSPNVLLIVLDTVAAGHLSLYGYSRPTSPTLDELAERGIRFDRVRATASWTLPSHASMFTGRWPHEVSAGWLTPLDGGSPTLAEYLGKRGYATAGFAANYTYCAADSGLARGFVAYRDYIFPGLTALKMAALVDRSVDGLLAFEQLVEDQLGLDFLRGPIYQAWHLFKGDRKEAGVVSREFLAWLKARRQVDRPFFAFLNFYDAHSPYQLRAEAMHRFGGPPRNNREADLLKDWMVLSRLLPSERQIAMIRDAYDDCVADLDEQLGCLLDDLERRGVLAQTWLIIASDHGESFGEHPGVYRHGTSLYETELHVPLIIVPPGGAPSRQVVTETVSLRDLPATIVDLLGFAEGSPFPGSSLAKLWQKAPAQPGAESAGRSPALSEVVPLDGFNPDPAQLLTPRWPLAALSDRGWNYVRREGDVREELFNVGSDAGEQNNLATDPAAATTLARMRQALQSGTAGPLTPDRFKR
jgi:arylsulfatase A-like enzyme